MASLCTIAALASFALLAAATAHAKKPYESTVSGSGNDPQELAEDRATSAVVRSDLEERLPRSAPDALRYEPGAFVQQTAHGQASVFLRGFTGQQTLMLFDGVRLNNSTYRQGPNQYFFTLDSRTIRSIEVQRGGGSTRWGTDALGGVLDALPLEPTLGTEGITVVPREVVRFATADGEKGGRVQLDVSGTTRGVAWGFLGGVGGRRVGLLNGPLVLNPDPTTGIGPRPQVPAIEGYDPTRPIEPQLPYLRNQLGTGFDELAFDGRLVVQPRPGHKVTIAAYGYRQFDVPRTDQCPAPYALFSECLTYEEQFRTLAYASWSARLGRAAERLRVTLSWQEQHELRRFDQTSANNVFRGNDDVETFGIALQAQTTVLRPRSWLGVTLQYGADTYFDWVRSRLLHFYTDIANPFLALRPDARGQYMHNSTYLHGGAFGDARVSLGRRWVVRGGVRVGWASADAPGQPESASTAVRAAWLPLAGHVGIELVPADVLRLFAHYDHSFRAPNLDDLTSRQATGAGYQSENPLLQPERAHTVELGAQLRARFIVADAWVFQTFVDGEMFKVLQAADACPMGDRICGGAWTRLTLQNTPGFTERRGVEGAVKIMIGSQLSVRATVSYVWSEGPNVGLQPTGDYMVRLGDRVPLSRTPPVNGTAEVRWRHPLGVSLGAALQWADAQTRLSIADYSDGRIPRGGTPGFAVVSLRASYRIDRRFLISTVLENLFDSPYRFHGSSVNGAGRGLILQLEASPFV